MQQNRRRKGRSLTDTDSVIALTPGFWGCTFEGWRPGCPVRAALGPKSLRQIALGRFFPALSVDGVVPGLGDKGEGQHPVQPVRPPLIPDLLEPDGHALVAGSGL